MATFENRLEGVMREKGVSTEDICFFTGLTYMTVFNARRGKNITLQTATLIAKALKVKSLDEIWPIGGEEEAA